MATHSQGVFGRMLFEPSSTPTTSGGSYTFDSASIRVEFLFEDVKLRRRIVGKSRGIRGRLSRASELGREGFRDIRGRIAMYISPDLVDAIASPLWGMTESPAGTFSLAESLPYFGIMIDREEGVFSYTDCKIDWLALTARVPQQGENGEPELVVLTMGIVASLESTATSWPSPEPAFVATATDAPYTLFDSDTGVTVSGEVRPTEELRLTWRNFLEVKAVNSLNAHSLRPRDREIQFYAKIPWNANTSDIHAASLAGQSGSLVFTNSTLSTQFNFANLQVEIQSPTIRGKMQTFYEIFAEAGSSGDPDTAANRELQIINDNTP